MKLKIFITIFFLSFASGASAQAITDTQYGNIENSENLTDQEKADSESFVHNEKAQRIYEEGCTADSATEDACLGNSADPKFLGMKSSMVSALGKAYVLIMGTAGGDLAKAVKSGETTGSADAVKKTPESVDAKKATSDKASAKADSGKEKEQKDYCKYIPMATETIATLNTTTEQETITNYSTSQSTAQKDSLLKAAANHESRAKTAKIQTTGWGLGTACYTYMMTMGGASGTDTGNYLKLGASALLTIFYNSQIGAHEDYADKTKAIADKMPGAGDCNPITDKLCFCTEESSKTRVDYQQYCQPEMSSQVIATTSERTTCINDKAEDDPSCACSQTNTCIDQKVMTTITGFNGQTLMSPSEISNFSSLASGELTSKALSSTQTSLSNALAALKKIDKKIELDPNVILTASQQEEVKVLEDMGLSSNFATTVATTPVTSAVQEAVAKFQGGVTNSKRSYSNSNRSKKKSKVLTFSGGGGINSNTTKSNTTKKPDFLSRFGLKKKKTKKNNQAVLKFAQRAENQAQISKNSDRQIFDIISRRYQVSGWRRLEFIK